MNLIIEKLNGLQYRFSEMNITINDFKIDSPSPKFNWEEIEGRSGVVDLGTTFGERMLRGDFEFVAESFERFPEKRNEIFRLFDSRESFYLIDTREPERRWLVKANGYSPDQLIGARGKINVDFISPSSFSESVSTILQSKNTNAFTISNLGDKIIDPREDFLLVTYTGASTNLKIKNNTNGDEWQYTGTSLAGDIVKLEGIRSLKNGLSIIGNTNKKLIKLEKGNNSFTLSGTSGSFTISFDFRHKYL